MHFEAKGFKLPGDDVGGSILFETKLRMGVNILAPASHFVLEFRDAVDHRHAMSLPIEFSA